MDLQYVKKLSSKNKVDALILGFFENEKINTTDCHPNDIQLLNHLIKNKKVTGKWRSITQLPSLSDTYSTLFIIGLGEKDKQSDESIRLAFGDLSLLLKSSQCQSLALRIPQLSLTPCILESLVLGTWQFNQLKTNSNSSYLLKTIYLLGAYDNKCKQAIDKTQILTESTNFAREIALLPGNHLTPSIFARIAQDIATKNQLKCTIFDESNMRKKGMGALLAVAQGSAEEAKFIILHYASSKAKKHLVLVGKGLTFDAGGICLKQPKGMEWMKSDMAGGAAVLATMQGMAKLKPNINLTAIIPVTENLPDGMAIKPGDVITSYSGKTIEVLNTDAEGRLVLADALAFAIKQFKPDAIVDLATLTGACVVALGHDTAGVMGNNQTLINQLQTAGMECGELLWQLPLTENHKNSLNSKIADLQNMGTVEGAGAIMAAAFLSHFVGQTPWAHLDIAGVANARINVSYIDTKLTSGFGVRLLTNWILTQC